MNTSTAAGVPGATRTTGTECRFFNAAWPTIVGLGVGMETYALMRDKGGLTLSSHVWAARDSGRPVVRKAAIGVVCLYLGIHFLFGGSQ